MYYKTYNATQYLSRSKKQEIFFIQMYLKGDLKVQFGGKELRPHNFLRFFSFSVPILAEIGKIVET